MYAPYAPNHNEVPTQPSAVHNTGLYHARLN